VLSCHPSQSLFIPGHGIHASPSKSNNQPKPQRRRSKSACMQKMDVLRSSLLRCEVPQCRTRVSALRHWSRAALAINWLAVPKWHPVLLRPAMPTQLHVDHASTKHQAGTQSGVDGAIEKQRDLRSPIALLLCPFPCTPTQQSHPLPCCPTQSLSTYLGHGSFFRFSTCPGW
jgi:hypothetical protein